MGASATQTGLGAPEGAEPPSRLVASRGIPSAADESYRNDIFDPRNGRCPECGSGDVDGSKCFNCGWTDW